MSARLQVLIACEFSGIVREAFNAHHGIDAVSCDLLPCEDGRSDFHIQGDAIKAINSRRWDLIIALPPCTDLAVSGARWFPEKRKNGSQQKSVDFFLAIVNADCPHMAVENPVGIMSRIYRKPDQIIQPWQFGHGEIKATCLWLKGLPKLNPTDIVSGRKPRVHFASPGPDRWKEQSRTLPGMAQAMASQWTGYLINHPRPDQSCMP